MIKDPTGYVAYCEKCWKQIYSDGICEYYPQSEDEFIEALENERWVVDKEGKVYCCEGCMKAKKEEMQ